MKNTFFSKTYDAFRAGLLRLSLRSRFNIVLTGLVFFSLLFAVFLLFRQHRHTVRSTNDVIRHQKSSFSLISARNLLIEINENYQSGAIQSAQISKFEILLATLEKQAASIQQTDAVQNLIREFSQYKLLIARRPLQGLDVSTLAVVQTHYFRLIDLLQNIIAESQQSVFNIADEFRIYQKSSFQLTFIVLFAFTLLVLLISFKLISFITNPISRLADFLDHYDFDKESATALPQFGNTVPELSLVIKSFEKLLSRLNHYHSINVKRLLLEKKRADIIAKSISDGIYLMRADEIIYMNPIGEKILNARQDANANAKQAIQKANTQVLPVEFEVEVDGRKLYYLFRSCSIDDEVIKDAGNLNNTIEPIHEILDRLKADTLILAQDVTLVRESQQAKGHFLATLSHEIKTPVTSLTMATRLLKKSLEQFPNPTHQSLISTCTEDVDRLRILLDDLLTVSKFDTLTQRLKIQRVDLGKLIQHTIKSFEIQAKEKDIELETQIVKHNGRPIFIEMDVTKVTWALSNLLLNALRHTPRGGRVELFIKDRNEWIEVKVKDTGPGIEKNRQERIFDRFNSYYDLRVARSGSVGAGLAIAKEIIVAHGGRIWVNSELSCGAEFCFILPTQRTQGQQAFISDSNATGQLTSSEIDHHLRKNRYF